MEPWGGLAEAAPKAPALGLAGAITVGVALGAGGGMEATLWVVVLGVGAIRGAGFGLDAIRRLSPLTLTLAGALVLGSAGRASLSTELGLGRPSLGGTPVPGAVGVARPEVRGLPRRSGAPWRLGAAAVRSAQPTEGPAAGFLRLEAQGGALRSGDLVSLAGTLEAPRRARGRDGPRVTRPVPPRPLADELIRRSSGLQELVDAHRPPESESALGALRARGLRSAGRHPHRETAGLLAALLFGDASRLEPGVADLFTRTGTRHMLALSGLHVGLLALLVALPLARAGCLLVGGVAGALGLRWTPSPRVLGAAMALAFIPLAGQGAPASRAALALALAGVGGRLGRRPLGQNLLGVALIVEVVMDPAAPMGVGVQLSYLATAALITAAAPASAWTLAQLPNQGRVARVGRTGRPRHAVGCAAVEKVVQGMAIGCATSVVATVATLPVVWSRFGEFSPVGIVATPLALPPLAVLVAGGWAWLAVPDCLWFDGVRGALGSTLEAATRVMLGILYRADHAPWSPIVLPERSLLWLAVAAGAFLMGCHGVRRSAARARGWLRLSAALFGLALLPLPGGLRTPQGDPSLEIHVADVGNGTAIVIRSRDLRTWVFDAGSRDRIGVARSAVGPLLRALDAGQLGVVLSHDDKDHAGALPWTARRWPLARWVGPRPSTRERQGLGQDPLRGLTPEPFQVGVTEITDVGSALRIRTIHGGTFDKNEGSCIVDLRAGSARVVLSGDAEGLGLEEMLAGETQGRAWLEPGPVDALLVPHHGSETPHLGWLLDRLQPREVWVSSSDEPLGMAEFERRGIPVRCTGIQGPFVWRAP